MALICKKTRADIKPTDVSFKGLERKKYLVNDKTD